MRSRPTKAILEEAFINEATADNLDQSKGADVYQFIGQHKWPMSNEKIAPDLAAGSNLNKPMSLPLKEFEWNSIDRHTRALGVQKTEWIRYAILKLMQEEQYSLKSHRK